MSDENDEAYLAAFREPVTRKQLFDFIIAARRSNLAILRAVSGAVASDGAATHKAISEALEFDDEMAKIADELIAPAKAALK